MSRQTSGDLERELAMLADVRAYLRAAEGADVQISEDRCCVSR